MKHCKNPCPECPYMKTSMEGYFGGNDPKEYAIALHRDTVVACHTKSRFGSDGMVTEPVICIGHLMAQKKLCKINDHLHAKPLMESQWFLDLYEEHKDNVLGFDFYTHHGVEHG